jgi:putative ABC transport system permease protein
MQWNALVRDRLREITGNAAHDAEIVEELAGDLEQRYEERLRQGRSDAEARADALAELADTETLRARLRRDHPSPWRPPSPPSNEPSHPFVGLASDIRYAARVLRASPGFAAAAILTLAVGIGAVTAIFSVVDAVLLKPVPYPDAERLVAVWETDRDSSTTHEPASVPDLLDFRQRATQVDQFGALYADELTLTPAHGEPTRLATMLVAGDLLHMLGARPVAGRLFNDAEYRDGSAVALISDRLWAREFRRDPAAIGRTLRLDDRPAVVIGVLPDGADVGVLQWLLAADYGRGFADRDARTRVDAWVPLKLDTKEMPRSTHPILVLGRTAPGASASAAQKEMTAITLALEQAYPDNKARGAHVEPFLSVVFGPIRPTLRVLAITVALVLVLACANVANMVLVRGTRRLREVAIRRALGATVPRLTRQFVIENALIALCAAALGGGVALATLRVLTLAGPADVPRLADAGLDARMLVMMLGLAAGVAVLFGCVPIAQARRLDLLAALGAEDSRAATAGGGMTTARGALVVAEVALALMLAVGAGAMIRSLMRLEAVDPGFQADGVLKAEFQLPAARYPRDFKKWPDFAEMHRFNASLLEQLAALPGINAVSIAGNHPLDAGFTNSFTIVGREAEGRNWPEISVRRVTPGYFRVVRVPVVRGRAFREGDATTAPAVALVNEAAAQRFFGQADPIGQQIRFWGTARTIVGLVGNERFHGVTVAAPPAVYAPLSQTPSADGGEVLLIRTDEPTAMTNAVRRAISHVDPGLAVFGLEPLRRTLEESFGRRRFVMLLLTCFAVIALALSAIGIYAVLSADVAARTREIGIRMALGARPREVLGLVLSRSVRLTGIGLVVGLAGALGLMRMLASLLFDVHARDGVSVGAALLVLTTVAFAASLIPAARALGTEPGTTLRQE